MKKYLMKIISFLARRFIAGQTLFEALDVIRVLNKNGLFTTFDHLGESVNSIDETKKATNIYLSMLDALQREGLDKNISVKLTQIGLDISTDLCRQNLEAILTAAKNIGAFVRIDMEGSDYTTPTLDIIKSLHGRYNNVGAVLQAMLRRTPDDAMNLIQSNISIRLCKGAYKEPANIAFQNINEIRKQYLSLSKRLITSGIYNGIATHDDHLIEELKRFVLQQNVSKDAFEFQMLYGMRRKLQNSLIKDGWRVRIYVPYGTHWLPYMLRRLRERKENVWFFVKNFFKG